MDVHGVSAGAEYFRVDDFLDLSNDDLFATSSADHHLVGPSGNSSGGEYGGLHQGRSGSFTADDICVPNDDAAQLEWLSTFVEDSFSDNPSNSSFAAPASIPFGTSTSHGRSRTNRGLSSPDPTATEDTRRRCTHCQSEKTPQWRAGPTGPKTLCNACGVRYKSGRLVPEYRPAASPTFVLAQHSNSHRKVMELRRQKEMIVWQHQQQQQQHQQQEEQQVHECYHHGRVC